MGKRKVYPKEFLDICDWVNEKVAKERAILRLEKTEKRQVQMLLIVIMALMIFINITFVNATLKRVSLIILIISLIVLFIYTFLENLKILKKKVEFKEIVLEEFAIHLKDGFTYEQNGEISESKYRKSGFDKAYNDFYSNSFMDGEKNGRHIGLANIIIKKRQKNNKLKETFKGAFAYATLQSLVPEVDLMKVNSTNNTREKLYIENSGLYMYSESIENAKRIIDDSIISEIVNLEKEFNISLECMVNKDMLFCRFFIDNMNNTLLYGTKREKEVLYKYYRIINLMELIARKIDCNVLGKSEEEFISINSDNNSVIENNQNLNKKIEENIYSDMNRDYKDSNKLDLNNFKIFPKIDLINFSNEFDEIINESEGIEIQLFDEKGKTEEVDIKSKIKKIKELYSNIKEVTIHPPIMNYDIEHVLFKDERIFEKQLYDIVKLSKKYKIAINLLYHTTWNIDTLISTGAINKIKKYIKILEGTNNKLLIENVYIIAENTCTPLSLCKLINHPNLKACMDITHLKVKANIIRMDFLRFIQEYLDKELCEKYVYQIHFATALNNDGFIDKRTHGRVHENENTMIYDLKWMMEYNLLNKVFVTEISEDDYSKRYDQIREISMLKNIMDRIKQN